MKAFSVVRDQKYESCCRFIVILRCSISDISAGVCMRCLVPVCVHLHARFLCLSDVCVYVCLSAPMCEQRWGQCQSPLPASWLCTQSHTSSPRHPCMFSTGTSPFSKTNTQQAASQPHHSTHHTDRAVQPPCSLLASVDWPSFAAWSSLTAARLLIGGSCKMSNYCSLG